MEAWSRPGGSGATIDTASQDYLSWTPDGKLMVKGEVRSMSKITFGTRIKELRSIASLGQEEK
jgi:hypothetical protein